MPVVGETIPHDSALGHVTGTAPFLDDLAPCGNELHVTFVGSPVAHGTIQSIETEHARRIPGVVEILTSHDVPGAKKFGPVVVDEPVLPESELLYVGQPVVIIAAETTAALAQARKVVEIQCSHETALLGIEQAIQAESFLGPKRQIRSGDAEQAIVNAPFRLRGVFQSGGQEQFYLESQSAIAYPGEQSQIVVHASTQNPTEIQAVVAEVLGIGQHQVVCVCKRMGGAFGGKETQAALPALMVALVAQRTNRAARVVYNKDDDMLITGKRHAYRTQWEVGFEADGTICGLTVDLYSDGGAATDLSLAVMERSMMHVDNTYFIPNVEINGQVCFTNLPPNTAFRGFGGPQAVAAMENIIENIATARQLDAHDVRIRNLYGISDRNVTPYGQKVDRNHLPDIFGKLANQAMYKERRDQIAASNRTSKLQLRGIALTGVKFGISFTTRFLNQGNALVNVYTDGSVQVSTGGTEMGQGLNTKIQQIVADQFALDAEQVVVMPTSTEKNNNTSPTAASAGTDLNGAAAVDACRKIKQRLRHFAVAYFASLENSSHSTPEQIEFHTGNVSSSQNPSLCVPFGELVAAARRERVDLGARGFYATPGIDFDREAGRGTPFMYYTQGAAVAEVVIDRFTGQLEVPRIDLLIDIGRSINPGVDMGQITGGFIQGMGWVTNEALIYDDSGALLSHSPTTYKIPVITDVPQEFHCELFPADDNVENVCHSKAVGEPPLMLGISVWAAIKNALSYNGDSPQRCDLQIPATGEEILRCIETGSAKILTIS